MGRDNQPKERQLARKAIKAERRAPYARVLIVSEGTKTEPLYFEEIRAAYQLHSANVLVQPSQLGTAPIQVVQYAKQLIEEGDLHKGIRSWSFDEVYAVFDRDDHGTYFDALQFAQSLDRKLRNDNRDPIVFRAIASVPSFELWPLLHYEDIQAPIHRDEVMERLKRHIPGYEKGADDVFARTRDHLEIATQRARALAVKFNAYTAPEPYTAIGDLVGLLTKLRN
jgi:hypothetical protein